VTSRWARLGPDAVAAVRGTVAGVRFARSVFAPPREPLDRTPRDVGLTAETWSWSTSRDGLRVDAWFVPGSGPDAVVVAHGMGRSRASVLEHVALLHAAGLGVLAVDSRNHGTSAGNRRTWSLATRFTSDLCDAVARLRADGRVTGRVGVLAFSFACWPALRAARREGCPVDAVVCDSGPVPDMEAAVGRLAGLRAALLDDALRHGVGRASYVRAARRAFTLALAERAWPPTGDGPPVLLVAGGRDGVLPVADVQALADALPDARTWVVPRAGHLRALAVDPAGYADVVVGFLSGASVGRAGG